MRFKERRDLLRLARQGLNRERYKRLKQLKRHDDFEHAAQYCIVSFFEHRYEQMQERISTLEAQGKDVFFLKNSLLVLPSKISHLRVRFSEKEFMTVQELFQTMERELDGV